MKYNSEINLENYSFLSQNFSQAIRLDYALNRKIADTNALITSTSSFEEIAQIQIDQLVNSVPQGELTINGFIETGEALIANPYLSDPDGYDLYQWMLLL
ncbi:hypothetical protein [Neptuniibacter sp.]|uniref:hypothetical protein n=1 Tax=Neptuniibacter sp. TaxID=1962643 RepID=UPI002636D8B3|nr:hypothetical protein [Neptuniibacter sp.]MCP4598774.1 hypothetical protein [Neptuniibacter sp.]